MNTFRFSYDSQRFQSKPSSDEVRFINNRIARSSVKLGSDELRKMISNIGDNGCSFCPATFKDGKRNKENFEQQQLIALDFDNKNPDKKISFEDVKKGLTYMNFPYCLLMIHYPAQITISLGWYF